MRGVIGVLAATLAIGCSQECLPHSHGVDLTDGGGFACEADMCWKPVGDLDSQGFEPNPGDHCDVDAGAAGDAVE